MTFLNEKNKMMAMVLVAWAVVVLLSMINNFSGIVSGFLDTIR